MDLLQKLTIDNIGEVFKLPDQTPIPRYVKTEMTGEISNIQRLRGILLKRTSKTQERNLRRLEGWCKGERLIPEYPVLINNRDLWIELCRKYKLLDEDYCLGFFLDCYIPSLGIAVETDSPHHSGRIDYDKARDEYIMKETGILIKRVWLDLKSKDILTKNPEKVRIEFPWECYRTSYYYRYFEYLTVIEQNQGKIPTDDKEDMIWKKIAMDLGL